MSNAILNLAFKYSRSRGVSRLVLLSIADRANDEGKAWCGTVDIAKRAGIKRQHVTRHTDILEAIGELEKGFREGPGNTNLYRVTICPEMGQSQGKPVPTQFPACPTLVQNMPYGGTQTSITQLTADIDTSSDSSFSAFWTAYPRKVSKKSAFRAWKAAKGIPPIADILSAIERQKNSEQWQTEKFIPHPATWLNGARWDDDLPATKHQSESKTPNEPKYDY